MLKPQNIKNKNIAKFIGPDFIAYVLLASAIPARICVMSVKNYRYSSLTTPLISYIFENFVFFFSR